MQSFAEGKKVGFVPTMGFLHKGHLSLVRQARKENDFVVVSIFVNPTQFGPQEDFAAYPRDFERDKAMLEKEGVDVLLFPAAEELYPGGLKSDVKASPSLAKSLCGPFRPGHFDGVATVVKKLFEVVRPASAYFGQKDFQQTRVIERMVSDFAIPVKVVVCPTVRESDGLAMSSRNTYLSPEQRKAAPLICRTLFKAKKRILDGKTKAGKAAVEKESGQAATTADAGGKAASERLEKIKAAKTGATNAATLLEEIKAGSIRALVQGGFRVQYFSIVSAGTLEDLQQPEGRIVIATAAYLGKTRLIDNVVFTVRAAVLKTSPATFPAWHARTPQSRTSLLQPSSWP